MEDGEGMERDAGLWARAENEEFAGLFKPNSQTHEERLTDPWPIKNSITGEGTSGYMRSSKSAATTSGGDGENSRRAQREDAESFQPYRNHPDYAKYFVKDHDEGKGPHMALAEKIWQNLLALGPLCLRYGNHCSMHHHGDTRGYVTAGDGVDPATTGHEDSRDAYHHPSPTMHPLRNASPFDMQDNTLGQKSEPAGSERAELHKTSSTANNARIHQRVRSRGSFHVPIAEIGEMPSMPASRDAVDKLAEESRQKSTMPNGEHPVRSTTPPGHGLGDGLWPLPGLRSSAASSSGSARDRMEISGTSPGQSKPKSSQDPSQSPTPATFPVGIVLESISQAYSFTPDESKRVLDDVLRQSRALMDKSPKLQSADMPTASLAASDDAGENPQRSPSSLHIKLPWGEFILLVHTNAELIHKIKTVQEERYTNADRWQRSVREMADCYKSMYSYMDKVNEAEKGVEKKQAELNTAQQAMEQQLQQSIDQLQYERQQFEHQLANKDEQLAGAKEEINRLKEAIISLQQRIKELHQQKAENLRKMAAQQQQAYSMTPPQPQGYGMATQQQPPYGMAPYPQQGYDMAPQQGQGYGVVQQHEYGYGTAQQNQYGYDMAPQQAQVYVMAQQHHQGYDMAQQQQQGYGIAGFPAQPPFYPTHLPQGIINGGFAQQLPAFYQSPYNNVANAKVRPIYYPDDDQGVINGPPEEEYDENFDFFDPPSPPPLPPTPTQQAQQAHNVMDGWDSDQLTNESFHEQGGFAFSAQTYGTGDGSQDIQHDESILSKAQSFEAGTRGYTSAHPYRYPMTPQGTEIKVFPVFTPPFDASNLGSRVMQRQAVGDNISPFATRNQHNPPHVVAHPADDVFRPLTQSPIGPRQNNFQEEDFYSKPYTSLFNACFSKVEDAVRKMTIAPVTELVRRGDKGAEQFLHMCQKHLKNDEHTWALLDDFNGQYCLVTGIVESYVVEYAIFAGVLAEFQCSLQDEFAECYEREIHSFHEDDATRRGLACERAELARKMTQAPTYLPWLRSYVDQTIEYILGEVEHAFVTTELPTLQNNLRQAVYEALSIGVRILQDPRRFEYRFPELGTRWDHRYHVHRNVELVGQHLRNEKTPYFVRCAIRPTVWATDFGEEQPHALIMHRAEVLVSKSKRFRSVDDDLANRHDLQARLPHTD